jgi:tetratricopeptide (TPR) repeat protein
MENFWALSRLLGNLGYMALNERDYAEANRFFDEAVVSAQKVHHLNWLCDSLYGLVLTALAQGDFAQARQHAENMRRISGEIGERHEYFKAIVGLAEIASVTGNDAEARHHLREALRLVPELDEQDFFLYLGLAAIPLLVRLQAVTQAVLVIGFFQQHPTWISSGSMEWEKLQGYIEQIEAQLPADTYAVAWNEGQTLALDTLLSILHAVI